jgi:hypothetical protein
MQKHAAEARDELVEAISDLMARALKPAATPAPVRRGWRPAHPEFREALKRE